MSLEKGKEKEMYRVLQMMKLCDKTKTINQVSEEKELRWRLFDTLQRAHDNVPYYHSIIPKRINIENIYEILNQIPLLDKNIIRIQQIGNKIYSRVHSLENRYWGKTGGTTGVPLCFPGGYIAEESHGRALYEYITGVSFAGNMDKLGDIASIDGVNVSFEEEKAGVYWKIRNPDIYGSVSYSSVHLSELTVESYLEQFQIRKHKFYRGYSNAFYQMAQFMHKKNIKLNYRPLGIYVTSESCSKEAMNYISESFDCPVHGQYGQVEGGMFAWTRANDDRYYCSPFYGYVEVLDKKGQQVGIGEVGEVVVTGFGNRVMPFIRYRLGDRAIYGGKIGGVVILDKLQGRINEFIYNSRMEKIYLVGWIDIHYLKFVKNLVAYEVEQYVPGEVIFHLIPKDTWSEMDSNSVRELFALKQIQVIIDYCDKPFFTKNGKRRFLVQHIKS